MVQKIDYTRYYEKWHPDTADHINSMKAFYQRTLSSYLSSNKNIKILDVGCGQGFALMALQELGYTHLSGIDIDSGQVKACRRKGIDAIHVEDSLKYLAEHQFKYDLILALDVIEHIPHCEQLEFTQAIYDSLASDGKIICTVPNANSTLAGRWRYSDWTHQISFTEDSLDFLLYNAGFVNIVVSEIEFFGPVTVKSVLKVLPLLHRILFLMARASRRLTMMAELGFSQGREIPLSLNLLATASKQIES